MARQIVEMMMAKETTRSKEGEETRWRQHLRRLWAGEKHRKA